MNKLISCVETGVQWGRERFRDTPFEDRPRLKAWRCELTGLSRVHNLYFVAYSDTVYVYQPNFPDQELPEKPALVLHPPVSGPRLRYYIDDECPHSINRLHVDFLGTEEVVLVCCDDGDVIGYRVSQVQHAIDQRHASEETLEKEEESQVKVFLHRNVGISAWGLAIHSEARLIAISANNHMVMVIALALARRTSGQSVFIDSSTDSSQTDSREHDFPYSRQKDHVFHLQADSNIPSVSFDNSGADPSGRWLFSSCIDGHALLWDLRHRRDPPRKYSMGRCSGVHDHTRAPRSRCVCTDCGSIPHAVWNAFFIDSRSCRMDCDVEDDLRIHRKKRPPCFWDISNNKPGPFTSSYEKIEDPQVTKRTTHTQHLEKAFDQDEGDSDNDDDEDNLSDSQDEHDESSQADDGEDSDGGDSTTEMSAGAFLELIDDTLLQVTEDVIAQADSSAAALAALSAQGFLTDSGIDYRASPSKKKTYFDFSVYGESRADRDYPPMPPALVVSKDDLYLLQPRYFSSSIPSNHNTTCPIITVQFPQWSQGEEEDTTHVDRLCYSTQIPELGVVLVGTPAGRVVVLSLTKTVSKRRNTQIYGFKIDHVLPSEEAQDELDYGTRMIGFAVGPVQGMLDAPVDDMGEKGVQSGQRARRWRLMMAFQDHTVMSFELGKKTETEDTSVSNLVV